MLERLSESLDAQGRNFFNNNSTANPRDSRSDDKGVEPESVVVGEVNGRPYAFVGLERDGGSNPATGVLLIVSNEASSTTTIWKLD